MDKSGSGSKTRRRERISKDKKKFYCLFAFPESSVALDPKQALYCSETMWTTAVILLSQHFAALAIMHWTLAFCFGATYKPTFASNSLVYSHHNKGKVFGSWGECKLEGIWACCVLLIVSAPTRMSRRLDAHLAWKITAGRRGRCTMWHQVQRLLWHFVRRELSANSVEPLAVTDAVSPGSAVFQVGEPHVYP